MPAAREHQQGRQVGHGHCSLLSRRFQGILLPAVQVFPSAQYYKRAGFPLKKICQYAAARGFTDVLVANEDRKSVNGLLLIHLPGGPTAHFRLSKLVLSKDIKVRDAPAVVLLRGGMLHLEG